MSVPNEFIPKNTIIERVNPNTKLLCILAMGVGTLIFPNVYVGLGAFIFLCFVAGIAKILKNFVKIVLGFGIPVTVMLLFIQGLFSPQNVIIIADFGFAKLGLEGVLYALKIVITLLVFLGAFLIMNQTTYSGNLVAALTKRGLSGKAAYLVLASLNVVPQMQMRIAIIRQAQEARGVETQGKLWNRIKAFFPLLGPMVMSSLINAQERGMTLETRGFGISGVKPTNYVQATSSKIDTPMNIIMISFLLIVIVLTVLINGGML